MSITTDYTADRVLQAIRDHIAEVGWPPSVAEIGGRAGLLSKSSVHHHLVTLEREGRIERGPCPRQIRVVSEGAKD